MGGYVGENKKLVSFIKTMTSVASTGLPLRCDDCENVTVLISAGATGNAVTYVGGLISTITVTQGSSAETATAAGLATAVLKTNLGSTAADRVAGVQSAIITCTSGKNGGNVGETVVINGYTMTVVTTVAANGTYYNSTGGIRSSLISTNTTDGPGFLAAGIAQVLNSTLGSSVYPNGGLGSVFRASTPTTGTVRVDIRDDAQLTSGITIVCGTGFTPAVLQSQAMLEFPVSLLDSTSKYIAVNMTTWDANVDCNVTYIKDGVRYKPSFQGQSARYRGSTA